jgi:hypothetical protein
MRITVERGIDAQLAERFLRLYREAFEPIEVLGAQRQSMHDDEFLDALVDPRVVELIGWQDDEPVAMAVMTLDLEVLPWFSAPFFKARLPEVASRGESYAIIAILVRADVQGGPWYRALAEAVALKAYTDDAVVVFDCCRYNVEVFPMPKTLVEIGSELFDEIELVELDTQHYFALDADGLRFDLRGDLRLAGGAVHVASDALAEKVIDLRDQPVAAAEREEQVIDLRDDARPEAGYPTSDH